MLRVAALDGQLGQVASLREPMQELAGLRQPMTKIATLGEPMMRVATLLGHPLLIFLCVLLFLAMWGGVTFFAVRLAILSARGA
jgi:hypothetical protein